MNEVHNMSLSYMKLLRWLRENHVTIDRYEIELPLFKSSNKRVKVYFEYVSLTGFHRVEKVVLLENNLELPLSELAIDRLLHQEANYRTKSYTDVFTDSQQFNDTGLFSLTNCEFTERFLVGDKLFNIAISSQNQDQELEKINKLKKELMYLENPIVEFWLSSNFIPGLSSFYPMMDGIGNIDNVPFHVLPRIKGGEQVGRLWLNNPLNPEIDKSIVPSLDFFDPFELSNGWSMRDVSMEDLNKIHQWMNEPILANTFHQNFSLEAWYEELNHLIQSPFTRPMIGSFQNEECAYIEFYRPAVVQMGRSFLFDPTEIGFHLGIIKADLLNKKMGRKIIDDISKLLLIYPKTLVGGTMGEPDVNNLSMFKAATKYAGYHVATIAMPHKCSYVVRCHEQN
ncbi:MAG: GNAT family N-acetyltransferase [Neisseriaceae bacterium]|nr:MAG: GNAT family N-acetyltransferase [Neisseriaceae bacterium]